MLNVCMCEWTKLTSVFLSSSSLSSPLLLTSPLVDDHFLSLFFFLLLLLFLFFFQSHRSSLLTLTLTFTLTPHPHPLCIFFIASVSACLLPLPSTHIRLLLSHTASAAMVATAPSSAPQQRNIGQQLHSALSAHHLAPHSAISSSHSHSSSYASSISSAPGSRPASPAMNLPGTMSVPTPPHSPTAYQLKTFASSTSISSAPSTPPVSTIIAMGSPGSISSPHSSSASYFPYQQPPQASANINNNNGSGNSVNNISNNSSNNNNNNNPGNSSPSISRLLVQPVTGTVLALTVILTAVGLGGKFPAHCTSPSHVIFSMEYLSLLVSPFVIPLTPSLLSAAQIGSPAMSLVLAGTNLMSLALFEDHLTAAFQLNGSRIFRNLCLLVMGLVMAVRMLMGFVFSRAVGWHIPSLFFSDSMFECNLGLAPYLFALLIVQSLFPSTPFPSEKSGVFWRKRKTLVQIVLCLLNGIPKTIVWWAGAGMVVGFFAALVISIQHSLGHWGGRPLSVPFEKLQLWDDAGLEALLEDDDAFSDSTLTSDDGLYKGNHINKKNERPIWKTFAYTLPTLLFLLLVLLTFNKYHTHRPDVSNVVLSSSVEPETPFLLTLILMTAPRKRGTTYIKETLSSYLANFPDEEVDPLYSRIQIVVYTHFTDFPGYDEAKLYFDKIPKARKHVQWIREDGFEKNHRHHLVSAIRKIGTQEDSVYLGLMEDDFPFCEDGWQTMLNTLYEANQKVQDHCGLFVGTGGSGLIFKRSVALTASFILEEDALVHSQGMIAPPPDISLQDCLMGEHEYCSSCAGTLVTSRTLLQRHLGYNSSTSGDGYDKNQFQCGWRQPFNGLPTVHTL